MLWMKMNHRNRGEIQVPDDFYKEYGKVAQEMYVAKQIAPKAAGQTPRRGTPNPPDWVTNDAHVLCKRGSFFRFPQPVVEE